MSSQWTDELRQQVIAEYEEANPTHENTTEILEEIAEKHGKTVNGLRLIISKAGKYISATPPKSTSESGDKPKRKSKQESLDELTAVLEGQDVEVDSTIIDKLTGKAAEYFIAAFTKVIDAD